MSATTEMREPLVRLFADYMLVEAEYRRLTAMEDEAAPEQSAELRAALDGIEDRYHELMETIAETSANDPVEMRAKAAAVLAFFAPDLPDTTPADRMLWSLVRDLAEARA